MANIKSQQKRNRQNVKRYQRNKSFRSELRTHEKRVLAAAEAGDVVATEELLREAQKRIDVAASRGVLHANTAARRKSRLTRRARSVLA
jgi:small subunit ribosomal protein S20